MRRPAALRGLMVGGALLLSCSAVARAQQEPCRPALPADADTNDADAYYQYGVLNLRGLPGSAAEAFSWAHRLRPDWAEPLYGQWVALILSRGDRWPEDPDGGRSAVSVRAYASVDSLYAAALELDPFLHRRFDRMFFDQYLDGVARRYESRAGLMLDRAALQRSFDADVISNPWLGGWLAYADGRWDDAITAYGQALGLAGLGTGPLVARARAAFHQGDYVRTLADLTTVLNHRRRVDDEDPNAFYDPRALLEQSIGLVYERMSDTASARLAYVRALLEDPFYALGHIRLAALALSAGDTVTAVSEYSMAARIRDHDPVARYHLGVLLRTRAQPGAAAQHLEAAIAAEPLFAPPYVELGRAYEALGRTGDAQVQYRAFLAHADRRDPERIWTRDRLAALGGALPDREPESCTSGGLPCAVP